MIYVTWTLEILELTYWTRIDFMIFGVTLEMYFDYLTGFGMIL